MARGKLVLGLQTNVRTLFVIFSLLALCCTANAQHPGEFWQVRDQKDGMTGKSSFFGLLDTKVESNDRTGTAEIKATCDASALEFQITYVADFDRSLGLRRVQPAPIRVFGQASRPQPVVNMRVSIDGYLDTMELPSSHENVVTFEMHGMQSSYNGKREGRATPMAGILDQSAKHWAVDAVVQAKLIKFELPLANGDTPIVEIRPQDASFRRFVDRCNAERSLVPRTPGYLREDKRFAGTADQLAAAFPEMLRQAAAHVGLDGRK